MLAVMGCGGGGTEGPKTFPVTGKLTVGGQPVPDVIVQLIPLDPAKLGAAGKTDASGQFKVTATNGTAGAVAGKYKVVLQKTGGMDASQYTNPGAGGPPKVTLPFPAEYAAAATTPKEIDVGNAAVTLDLAL